MDRIKIARKKAKKFGILVGDPVSKSNLRGGEVFKLDLSEMRGIEASPTKRYAIREAGFEFQEIYISNIVFADHYLIFVPLTEKDLKPTLLDKILRKK